MFKVRRPWGACWMVSVTERVKTLWAWGRGVSRLRFPPATAKAAASANTHPFARLGPGEFKYFQVWVGFWCLVGSQGPWPTSLWDLDPGSLAACCDRVRHTRSVSGRGLPEHAHQAA